MGLVEGSCVVSGLYIREMLFRLNADWMMISENEVTEEQNISCDGKD